MKESHKGRSGCLIVVTVSSSEIKEITLLNIICPRTLYLQSHFHRPALKQTEAAFTSYILSLFCSLHILRSTSHQHTLGFVLYQMSPWVVGCHLLKLRMFNLMVHFATFFFDVHVSTYHKRKRLLTCPHTNLLDKCLVIFTTNIYTYMYFLK